MKNSILSLAVTALLSCVLYSGCWKYDCGYYEETYIPTEDVFATLKNYSSEDTVWYIPDKEHSEELPQTLSDWQKISVYEIPARSSENLYFDSTDNYTTPLETYGTADAMVFYVFRKSDWDSHSWEELLNGQMWAGRCSLTVTQMLDSDQTVSYPFQ